VLKVCFFRERQEAEEEEEEGEEEVAGRDTLRISNQVPAALNYPPVLKVQEPVFGIRPWF
jgi:hypothetical protein